MNLSYILAITF